MYALQGIIADILHGTTSDVYSAVVAVVDPVCMIEFWHASLYRLQRLILQQIISAVATDQMVVLSGSAAVGRQFFHQCKRGNKCRVHGTQAIVSHCGKYCKLVFCLAQLRVTAHYAICYSVHHD